MCIMLVQDTNLLVLEEFLSLLIHYISIQNSARIIRALFEMAIRKNWSLMASRLLTLSKCVDRRLWNFDHPLSQFPNLKFETINRLSKFKMDRLREMSASEIGK